MPVEDLTKYKAQKVNHIQNVETVNYERVHLLTESRDDPNEPSELLSRTLKRKFTELDEITQRLRLRLSKVTEEDSDTSSDGIADQFEKDINTLSIEEDFDLINFENETQKCNILQSNEKDQTFVDSTLLMTNSKSTDIILDDYSTKESVKSSNFQSGSEGFLSVETINNGKFNTNSRYSLSCVHPLKMRQIFYNTTYFVNYVYK